MPKNILGKLDIKPVRWIDQVLELALQKMPTPLEEKSASDRKASNQGKGKKNRDGLRHH
jgi:ATP-dependent Lon protease